MDQQFHAFLLEAVKLAEYAPGLPEKGRVTELPEIKGRTSWELAVHDHRAERAGRHFDLRLGDPETGIAHSWAIPKAKLPGPGERPVLAIRQPDHTIPYMDFKGRIEEGYGKGDVGLHIRDKAEVFHASPDKVKFNRYTGRGQEEFILRRTPKNWLLQNVTKHRKSTDIPNSKPKYKEKRDESLLDPSDSSKIWQPKVDGAHNTFLLQEGRPIRAFSYRPTERKTGLLEHSHKVPGLMDKKVPKELHDTVVRGELFARSPGKATPLAAETVGGMLNASVWNSRKKQQEVGELEPVIFDVVRYRGVDMEDAPYPEKMKVLKEVEEALPILKTLPMSFTQTEKEMLLDSIKRGRHGLTEEGIIEWDVAHGTPTKYKLRPDHDVYLTNIFKKPRGEARGHAGGFEYSWAPGGPTIGRVGTGFDHALRKDMLDNPDKYIGRAAKVKSQSKGKRRALRAPSFLEWHIEKGKQA